MTEDEEGRRVSKTLGYDRTYHTAAHQLFQAERTAADVIHDNFSISFHAAAGEDTAEWLRGSDVSSHFANFIWRPQNRAQVAAAFQRPWSTPMGATLTSGASSSRRRGTGVPSGSLSRRRCPTL